MYFSQVAVVIAILVGQTFTAGGYSETQGGKRRVREIFGDGNGGRIRRQAGREKGNRLSSRTFIINYHVRDELNNTHFRQEYRDQDGTLHGTYGYTNINGLFRCVVYVADGNGHRTWISTNEPGVGRQNPAHVNITLYGKVSSSVIKDICSLKSPEEGSTIGPPVGPKTKPTTVDPPVGPKTKPTTVDPPVGPKTEPTVGTEIIPTVCPTIPPIYCPKNCPTIKPTYCPKNCSVIEPPDGDLWRNVRIIVEVQHEGGTAVAKSGARRYSEIRGKDADNFARDFLRKIEDKIEKK